MGHSSTTYLAGVATRMAVLAGLWWLIAQGQPEAWLVGLPAVGFATFASMRLGNAARPQLAIGRLPGFAVLFLRESVLGGIDVARRTLAPTLRIKPGFRTYHLQLRDPRARVLLVNCISLLPGTLAADCQGDRVELHLLDANENPDPQIRRLERAIAGLYRLPLETADV